MYDFTAGHAGSILFGQPRSHMPCNIAKKYILKKNKTPLMAVNLKKRDTGGGITWNAHNVHGISVTFL